MEKFVFELDRNMLDINQAFRSGKANDHKNGNTTRYECFVVGYPEWPDNIPVLNSKSTKSETKKRQALINAPIDRNVYVLKNRMGELSSREKSELIRRVNKASSFFVKEALPFEDLKSEP